MSLINFSVKHNRTPEDAKICLGEAVEELRRLYGPLVRRVEWSPDRERVTLTVTGAVAEMRVDAEYVHAVIDIPVLGGLLGGRMAGAIKEIVQKQLGGPGARP